MQSKLKNVWIEEKGTHHLRSVTMVLMSYESIRKDQQIYYCGLEETSTSTSSREDRNYYRATWQETMYIDTAISQAITW